MSTTPPGWYSGLGDPDGTERWWDGETWVGEPRQIGSTLPPPPQTTLGAPVAFPPMPGTWVPTPSQGTAPAAAASAAVGFTPAGAGRRIAATIADFVIGLVFLIPLFADMVGQIDRDIMNNGGSQTVKVGLGLALVGWAVQRMYHVVGVALWGATLGRAMFGLRVVSASDPTQPPGFASAFVRHLPFLVASFLATFGTKELTFKGTQASYESTSSLGSLQLILAVVTLIMVVSDTQRRRSLSDRCGKTYVVRKP